MWAGGAVAAAARGAAARRARACRGDLPLCREVQQARSAGVVKRSGSGAVDRVDAERVTGKARRKSSKHGLWPHIEHTMAGAVCCRLGGRGEGVGSTPWLFLAERALRGRRAAHFCY